MAFAEIDGDRIRVQTAWNEKELIKQVPGARWDSREKVWHVALTWSSCIILRGMFGSTLTIGDTLLQWAWRDKARVDWLLDYRMRTEPTTRYQPLLYPFQEVGSNFLMKGTEVLLGDEMGTGKTIQVLAALNTAYDPYPAFVVCPNSVKSNWEKEAPKWSEAHPYVVRGSATERKRIIETAASDPLALIIVNFESLRTLTRLAPYGSTRLRRCRSCDKVNGEETLKPAQCQVHPKELNKITFKTVVIDEAHRIKEPQSQQTRATWAVAHMPSVINRWALTGTPLANNPGDLWSILHCISPTEFPTKTHFIDRFCLQSWNAFGGLSIVGLNPANRDEFYKIFDPHWRRMPKDLVLTQLPPKVRTTRWVELSTTQRKMYNQFEKGLAAQTAGGVLVAENAMVARLRQMQISSATPTVEAADVVALTEPSTKLDELMVVLEELGSKPVAICMEHYKLLLLAQARLEKAGISYGVIAGPVNEYERDLALRRFQAGELRVLLFTIAAGGTGLTMTAADTIIFLQRSWSMINNKQAEDRVHRIGSEKHESVHIIDIVAVDTVEEGQIKSLTEKFMRLQEIARDRATILAAGGSVNDLDVEEAAILRSEL